MSSADDHRVLSATTTITTPSQDLNSGSVRASIGHRDGNDHQHRTKHAAKTSNRLCRYYGSKSGDACQFRHVNKQGGRTSTISPVAVSRPPENSKPDIPVTSTVRDAEVASSAAPQTTQRSVVAKPVPAALKANPREFQITQVVRRFAPNRTDESDGVTKLSLSLKPSDPDFPFELAALNCTLVVPSSWPRGDAQLALTVQNDEIPKGFQINIERGFSSLVHSDKSLLNLLNDLDRHLEQFLSSEKAQTIKIVANRGKRVEPDANTKAEVAEVTSSPLTKASVKPSWTSQEKAAAKIKREADIRQLEARMGRLPLFSASKDGIEFNIPVSLVKPARLPGALRALKELTLRVPRLYNLEPCTVQLKGVSGQEVANVESAFEKHVRAQTELSLMAHVNYLTQNLHELAIAPTVPAEANHAEAPKVIETESTIDRATTGVDPLNQEGEIDEERPHLVFLPRPPPEWNQQANEEGTDSSEETDSEEDYSESSADEDQGGAAVQTAGTTSNLEKGILFSFPLLEMTGIELLQVHNLSIWVKCDRCKESLEFKNIKPADPGTSGSVIRTESCNKCASPLSASYRAEPVHANSIKAGFLDLEGCTVIDMLPSNFLPTCSECSTTQPVPGIITVRGDTSLAVCRECHRKMTLKIIETKFLRVSINDARLNRALPPRRKQKENLGVTTGTELPDRGRCKHYAKSYRWFRFSCCNRVYACDRCHDETEAHPNEHANRMICGWCSREQNYRPDDCGACQRSVTRKTGGGFWEGGKGTRDRNKMSRKDPRKFKRIGGTTAGEKKQK